MGESASTPHPRTIICIDQQRASQRSLPNRRERGSHCSTMICPS